MLYVGTGSSKPYGVFDGTGMYRSSDGGLTWQKLPNFPNGPVPTIVVDPTHPSIIYAALMGKGVYKSSDGGTTWTAINSGIGDLYIYSLAIDPKNPNVLYAGTETFYGDPNWGVGNTYYGPEGLFKTDNAGESWRLVLQGGLCCEIIMINPTDSQDIFTTSHSEYVWHSTDGGQTWSLATKGLVRLGVHLYMFAIAMDSGGNWLYMGNCGRGVYKDVLKEPEKPSLQWERVIIDRSSVSSVRADVNSSQIVFFHAAWAKNGSSVHSGSIYVNDLAYRVNSSGWVRVPVTSSNIGMTFWKVTGVDISGLWDFEQSTPSPAINWDRILISVNVDGKLYPVGITSNSTVSGFAFSAQDKSMSFAVSEPSGTQGFVNVTWAKNLLNGTIALTIDEASRPFTLKQGSSNFSLYTTYTHSQHTIAIRGTTVVPEFPLAGGVSTLALGWVLVTLILSVLGARVRGRWRARRVPTHLCVGPLCVRGFSWAMSLDNYPFEY